MDAFAALLTAGFLSLVMCTAADAQPAPSNAPKHASVPPGYVGKWYAGDVKACKAVRRSPEGALVYTATQMFGAESTCKIERATKHGAATELSLLCRAEGQTSRDKELVEVVDGKLRRTVTVEGKTMSFT
jgi:hypothetical protein